MTNDRMIMFSTQLRVCKKAIGAYVNTFSVNNMNLHSSPKFNIQG
jgi:hypothetical protein